MLEAVRAEHIRVCMPCQTSEPGVDHCFRESSITQLLPT